MDVSRMRLAVAVAGVLAGLTAFAADRPGEPFALLSMDEVEKLVGKGDVSVVDANPEDVFRRNHLPGARWYRAAPLAQLLPAQKDRPVVFYCASPH